MGRGSYGTINELYRPFDGVAVDVSISKHRFMDICVMSSTRTLYG